MSRLGSEIEEELREGVSEETDPIPKGSHNKDFFLPLQDMIHILQDTKVLQSVNKAIYSEFVPIACDSFCMHAILNLIQQHELDYFVLTNPALHKICGMLTYMDVVVALLKISTLSNYFERRRFFRDVWLFEWREKLFQDKDDCLGRDTNPAPMDSNKYLASCGPSPRSIESPEDNNQPPRKKSFPVKPSDRENVLKVPEMSYQKNRHRSKSDSYDPNNSKFFGGGDRLFGEEREEGGKGSSQRRKKKREKRRKSKNKSPVDEEENNSNLSLSEDATLYRDPGSGDLIRVSSSMEELLDNKEKIYSRGLTPHVACLRYDASVWDAILVQMKYQVHKLPVINSDENNNSHNNNTSGSVMRMFCDHEILSCINKQCDFRSKLFTSPIKDLDLGMDVGDIGVGKCGLDTNLHEVLTLMVRTGMLFIPVLDDKREKVVDIFTKADVANVLRRVLESFNTEEQDIGKRHPVHTREYSSGEVPYTNMESDGEDEGGEESEESEGEEENEDSEDEMDRKLHINTKIRRKRKASSGKSRRRRAGRSKSHSLHIDRFDIKSATVRSIISFRQDSNRVKRKDDEVEKQRRIHHNIVTFHEKIENVGCTYHEEMMNVDWSHLKIKKIFVTDETEFQKVLRYLVGTNIRYLLHVDEEEKIKRVISIQNILEFLVRYHFEDFEMDHSSEAKGDYGGILKKDELKSDADSI